MHFSSISNSFNTRSVFVISLHVVVFYSLLKSAFTGQLFTWPCGRKTTPTQIVLLLASFNHTHVYMFFAPVLQIVSVLFNCTCRQISTCTYIKLNGAIRAQTVQYPCDIHSISV